MKIHAYIIAWNEERILPFTLDHYSKFCEKIYVYDNMSTDGSDEIYKKYDKVIVKKWQTPEKKYNQSIVDYDIKSNIYKQSRKYGVDWVIVCDCDEFLYHENLLEKLNEYKEQGITMPKIDGHDMFSETFPEYDGKLLTDKVKIGSKTYDVMCKNIIFNPILDIKYSFGSHSVHAPNAKFSENAELKLLHYKFLGKEYVNWRYNNLSKQLSDFNKKNRLGDHWNRPPMKYMDEMKEMQYKVI
jgi:hypothetical protein